MDDTDELDAGLAGANTVGFAAGAGDEHLRGHALQLAGDLAKQSHIKFDAASVVDDARVYLAFLKGDDTKAD